MDTSSTEQTTSTCGHCNRAIPSANIDLHYVHCSRNLEKCKVCEDMIPRKHAEEHYLSVHAPVSCSLCSETFERETLEVHKGESCPQRIVTCEYCEFPLPAVDLFKHQEVCGNRTELCNLCSKYIRLRERYVHEIQCNGTSERAAESSRDESVAAREREAERARGIARARGAERRQPNGFFPKRLLCTIAITGIAVLLGSFFLQRKADSHQMQ